MELSLKDLTLQKLTEILPEELLQQLAEKQKEREMHEFFDRLELDKKTQTSLLDFHSKLSKILPGPPIVYYFLWCNLYANPRLVIAREKIEPDFWRKLSDDERWEKLPFHQRITGLGFDKKVLRNPYIGNLCKSRRPSPLQLVREIMKIIFHEKQPCDIDQQTYIANSLRNLPIFENFVFIQ